MVSIDQVGSPTWAFRRIQYSTTKIQVAEIRHLENRDDMVHNKFGTR